MSEEKKYDFDFITGALGLVPYRGGAFNPAQVIRTTQIENDRLIITLTEGCIIDLNALDVLEMEMLIRKRQDEIKIKQREQIKEQMLTQQSVIEEINSRPAPGHIVPPSLIMKKGRN